MATNNEIVVTRAPRLKGVTWSIVPDYSFAADLSDGKVYSKIGTGLAVLAGKQAIGSNCHQMPSAVRWYPFEDFDAMCRWVANGRRLEDLSGDGRDEWRRENHLEIGQPAVLAKNADFPDEEGEIWLRLSDDMMANLSRGTCRPISPDSDNHVASEILGWWFWPLGPGDSITISPRNP